MFAPPVAKPKTKSAASSTNKLALQRSALVGHRFGDGAFEQQAILTANEPSAHAQEADATAAREAAPGPSWDFSKIPIFPPGGTHQPQHPFPFGGRRLPHPIQAKLVVGQVDDPLEHEADRVADQVMRMPAPEVSVAAAPPQLSRKCAGCEEEEKLQQKSAGPQAATSEAPASVHEVLSSPGQPLDAATRTYFEPRFGHDFSHVRVHTGASAEQSARDVNAHAYTVGHDMVFDAGRFVPGTDAGRRLIAHELSHTIQQSASNANRSGRSDVKQDLNPISVVPQSGGQPPAIARAPKVPPFRANQQDMVYLQNIMLRFFDLLGPEARASLLRNTTVVIALVTEANQPHLVYTVAGNSINPQIRNAAEQVGATRLDPEGIATIAGEHHAEQLAVEAAEKLGFKVHGMAVSRTPCADCGPRIAEEGIPIAFVRDPSPRPGRHALPRAAPRRRRSR